MGSLGSDDFTIALIADAKKAITELEKVAKSADSADKELDQLGTSAKTADKNLEQMSMGARVGAKANDLLRGAVMGAGIAIFNMAVEAVKSIPAMLDQADAIGDAHLALEAYAGSSAEADAAIKQIVEGTNGIVTEFEAAQAATLLFAGGLVDSADEAARMTTAAVTLGDAVGIDATNALDKFTTLMATGSTRQLKEFGLNITNVKKRTDELKAANEDLTEEEARRIAIMEEVDAKMGQLEEAGYEVGTSYERLKAKVKESKDELAVMVSDGILPVLDALEDMEDARVTEAMQLAASSESYHEYFKSLDVVTQSIPGAARELYILGLAAANVQSNFENTTSQVPMLVESIEDSEEAAREAAEAIEDELKANLDDLSLFIQGPVGKAFDDFNKDMGDLELQALDLKNKIDLLEEQEYLTPEQKTELGQLKTEYSELQVASTERTNQHEADTLRILFNLLQQRAAIDGVSEAEFQLLEDTAYAWGLIDSETWEKTKSIDAAWAAVAQGDMLTAKNLLGEMYDTVVNFPDTVDLTFNIHTNGTIPGGVSGIPIGAAAGFHGWVNQPTLFMAGEGGQPEYVNVTPANQVTNNNYNLAIHSGAKSENLAYDFRFMKQMGGAI